MQHIGKLSRITISDSRQYFLWSFVQIQKINAATLNKNITGNPSANNSKLTKELGLMNFVAKQASNAKANNTLMIHNNILTNNFIIQIEFRVFANTL